MKGQELTDEVDVEGDEEDRTDCSTGGTFKSTEIKITNEEVST